MFDFYERRKIRSIFYSKAVITVILILALALSLSAYERYTVEREMALRREVRAHELVDLKSRAAALESTVEHLKDERGIEEELRSRFDVAKAGEQVVILLDSQKSETDSNELSEPPSNRDQKRGERASIFSVLKFW